MLAHALFREASTKLTLGDIICPVGVGVTVTAATCSPTFPRTAPLKVESEATVSLLPLVVPMFTFPLAEKLLELATVTDAPASAAVKVVVRAATLTVLLLPAVPSTVFPLAVRVPPTVTSDVATTAALEVTGAALLAKVVTAFTVSVCVPAAAPTTVLPFRAVLPVTARLASEVLPVTARLVSEVLPATVSP